MYLATINSIKFVQIVLFHTENSSKIYRKQTN